ncbi:mitochondrial import protein Pam17 [Globomyces pollinis-pini]|nr:mitochondrial import protein Pam17 [Globomyces pollinis-pini]
MLGLRSLRQCNHHKLIVVSTQSTPFLSWDQFFKLKKSAHRWETATGIITGFVTFECAVFYFLTQAKYDPTEKILEMDPAMAFGLASLAIGGMIRLWLIVGGGFLVGNLMATPLWRLLKNKNILSQFDTKEKEFLMKIRKYRPKDLISVGPGDNARVLDYFGERIGSVKDYHAWLKVQRNFRKTGKLPHRLGG